MTEATTPELSPAELPIGPSRWVRICIVLAGLVGVSWALLSEYTTGFDPLLRFGGRFHVALVHFPIALIALGGVLAVFGRWAEQRLWSQFAHECAGFGAAAALLAAGTGWANAHFETYGGASREILFWHRWAGIIVAGVAVTAAAFASRSPRLSMALLVANAALVGWVGHLGGTLVHGPDYFARALRPVTASSGRVPSANPPARSSLYTAVHTILDEHCVECHGPRKQKGYLRLDGPEWIFEEGRDSSVVEPGDPSQSALYVRVTLPPHDDDFMPQKADPLSAESLDTIRRWIEAGAPTHELSAEAKRRSSLPDPSALRGSDEAAPVPVDETVLAKLRARGAWVSPLEADARSFSVSFRQAEPRATDEDLGLLDGLGSALVELDLTGSATSDSGLKSLGAYLNLRLLRLGETNVSGRGLASLEPLRSLVALDLHATAVEDDGLEALAQLSGLARVYLWGAPVTEAGLERFRALRPELEIDVGADTLPLETHSNSAMETEQ